MAHLRPSIHNRLDGDSQVRKFEYNFRKTLTDWPFYTAVAYFGLVAVVIWSISINSHTSRTQAHQAADESGRQAEIVANANSQYNACISSIPIAKKINNFIFGTQSLAHIFKLNTKAALDSTPKTDPQRATRLDNYNRVMAVIPLVGKPGGGVHFTVATKAQCKLIRDRTLKAAGRSTTTAPVTTTKESKP